MLQDIAPHVYNNDFKIAEPEDTDVVLYYESGQVLMRKKGTAHVLPTFSDLPAAKTWAEYAFKIDECGHFVIRGTLDWDANGFEMLSVKDVMNQAENLVSFTTVTGFQLWRWKNNHQFCSRCGGKMVDSETERALRCSDCGMLEFPRINPAVLMAVRNGDRLLMARYKDAKNPNLYLIAGYVEIGETLEQAVKREVLEEVGLHVSNIQYFNSQPWSISDSVMIAFIVDLDGDDAITLEKNELGVARWVNREDIPDYANEKSIAAAICQQFRLGKV